MNPRSVALDLGGVALALIVGALCFQYLAHFPPCEMCHWQRWPLFGAIAIAVVASMGAKDRGTARLLAIAAIVLVAASGAVGAYQAGVEWHWWPGPAECTGERFVLHGLQDLNAPGAVRCDVAAWRLLGISLAGYNALISLGSAAIGAVMLMRKR
jgi:disulfide bond formation protein DsbB